VSNLLYLSPGSQNVLYETRTFLKTFLVTKLEKIKYKPLWLTTSVNHIYFRLLNGETQLLFSVQRFDVDEFGV